MKDGFYTALGTPMDDDCCLNEESFIKQIEMQIHARAAGLLCMGSMGNMSAVRNREYSNIARICSEQVKGRVPLMIGVMDCSIGRVLDRIEALKGLDIDGVVATLPFYFKASANEGVLFFDNLARKSCFPVYMYDLPSVTQSQITEDCLDKLSCNPNIKGIKTGNMNLVSSIMRKGKYRDFEVFYSGLDTFDVALRCGMGKNLDGMFSCMPNNSEKMYSLDSPEQYLKNILMLRDIFVQYGVFSCYSYAMELIGCPGIYHSDFQSFASDPAKELVYQCMRDTGEIQ